MCRGDVLIAVDGNLVTGLSHGDVIHFMMTAARQGVVRLTLRRETGVTNGTTRLSQGQLHIQPQQLHDNASNSTCKTSSHFFYKVKTRQVSLKQFLVKYSNMSDKSNEVEKYNGSDSIELASARETIVLTRNESEGFGFVIMSSPR